MVAMWQFAVLAVMITWMSNIIKKPLAILGSWYFTIPIAMWVWLIAWINAIFPTLLSLTVRQAVFFGFATWVGSIAAYKFWLGNTEDNKTKNILNKKETQKEGDYTSLPNG